MFPHEEYLKYALKECMITKLVQDLGSLYSSMVAANKEATGQDLLTALQVDTILQKAALDIAALGPKPTVQ